MSAPQDAGRPASPAGLAPATVAVTAGRPRTRPGAAVNEAVWLTSTYVADGPYDYGRTGNPTWDAFETVLGALEGGRALVYSAGLAAMAAATALVPDGSVVVAPSSAYSGTTTQLQLAQRQGRLTLRQVEIADTDAVGEALRGADLLVVESPTNPMLDVADLPALVDLAHAEGALVVADNTFATPVVQRPLDHGVDVVVHSVTKYLAGHSDVVLGATVTRDDSAGRDLHERLRAHRHLTGSIAGPQEVWLALRGLRTLTVRVERAQANAAELARRLQAHPAVRAVRHPSLPDDPGHARAVAQMRGFGAIVSIEVDGDAAAAERVAAATRLWVHATSLGGVESSLERRRRHAAESPVVPESLLRLSVGIEDVDDLWADLDQALRA
ncbi:PLP-dependent aspartate aminotransferase family protein [Angustibacter sp. Root456]|uniref:trans-sulfuration enzyme family protein n=1 Tax=Angustibacter sp. Root456 TaxID=1736539 RepID=UPI000701004D|nr:aminotransferase class I/II-fold pyridoxal phosphate-dependent enzyme [Angustibacter sp. Root456]KQX69577.1 cystathionine gamma-synthase [Angustibacter sp. Root456]